MRFERKYHINDNYFENWSHSMAYILGFVTADGCIHPNHGNGQDSLDITISDKELVEYFRDELSPNRPIREEKRYKETHKQKYNLRINSDKICSDLAKLHVIQAKTGKEVLPDIPDEYKWDYFRGLFDGDGSVECNVYKPSSKRTIRYTRRMKVISGCEQFLIDIQNRILCGVGKIWTEYKKGYEKPYYVWKCCDKEPIKYIYRMMYKDKDLSCWLDRKYQIFQKMVETGYIDFTKDIKIFIANDLSGTFIVGAIDEEDAIRKLKIENANIENISFKVVNPTNLNIYIEN